MWESRVYKAEYRIYARDQCRISGGCYVLNVPARASAAMDMAREREAGGSMGTAAMSLRACGRMPGNNNVCSRVATCRLYRRARCTPPLWKSRLRTRIRAMRLKSLASPKSLDLDKCACDIRPRHLPGLPPLCGLYIALILVVLKEII